MNQMQIAGKKMLELLQKAIESGEHGIFQKGWSNRQHNAVSGRYYNGFNQNILAMTASLKGFQSAGWVTYNKVKEHGAWIKKSELANYQTVIGWRFPTKAQREKAEAEGKSVYTKCFTWRVYNLDQLEKVGTLKVEADAQVSSNTDAETIIDNSPTPKAIFGGDRAFYWPAKDSIHLPPREKFDSMEAFYGVMFHEMAHSTGHETRLGRKEIVEPTWFGDYDYGLEELVAEFTACMLMAECGLSNEASINNSIEYMRGWAEAIKDDLSMVVIASQRANTAANYILGIMPDYDDEEQHGKSRI